MSESETTTTQEPSRREPTSAAVRPHAAQACEQIWGSIFTEAVETGRVRSVLFASAERREGVSTMLAGAALTGASLWGTQRVAAVDLNVRHPQLWRLLGGVQSPGLADVLAGQADLKSIAQPVGSDNLLLYTAGNPGRSPMNMLSSERLRDTIAAIARDHEFVLCDCAAVNIVPDAQILAPMFDGVVLVTEAGSTRREALAQAKKRIEMNHGRVIGVVLNKRRYPVPRFLYRRS